MAGGLYASTSLQQKSFTAIAVTLASFLVTIAVIDVWQAWVPHEQSVTILQLAQAQPGLDALAAQTPLSLLEQVTENASASLSARVCGQPAVDGCASQSPRPRDKNCS